MNRPSMDPADEAFRRYYDSTDEPSPSFDTFEAGYDAGVAAARQYMVAALREADYALAVAERYLSKAVVDGELANTVVPVSHALQTIQAHGEYVRNAILLATGGDK